MNTPSCSGGARVHASENPVASGSNYEKSDDGVCVSISGDCIVISDDSASEDEVVVLRTSGKSPPRQHPRDSKGQAVRKRRGRRLPRTCYRISRSEQGKMVKFLIENGLIDRAKGLMPWAKMAKEGLTEHTADTLSSHFRRLLLPKIDTFPMKASNLRKFQELATKVTTKK